MPDGARLVANSVTLESDADMMRAQSEFMAIYCVELSAPKALVAYWLGRKLSHHAMERDKMIIAGFGMRQM